jgi:serine protease
MNRKNIIGLILKLPPILKPRAIPAFLMLLMLQPLAGQAQDSLVNAQVWDLIGLSRTAHFATFRHPVKIAVIDDGFDIDNPRWAAYIAHNTGDIPGNQLDDDHNGKVDDYEGWDFGDNDEDVRPARAIIDKESHGTRVLGVFWQTLLQLSNGAPKGVSILPIKAVSDKRMNNYVTDGYKGIEYAIQQKADIILCSWAGPNLSADEKAVLAKAQARGIIIIASAGNFVAMQPQYPGAFPAVIDVAATDDNYHKLRVSNYGTFVDICAPGDSLLTYNPYSQAPNARLSGTSAAAPVVAAIVTAIRAAWPGLSPAGIERLLKNTATPLDSANMLFAGNLGAGLVNVAAIRDALEGGPVLSSGDAAPETHASAEAPTLRQAQGFVDLHRLQAAAPVRIEPTGRYTGIKFLLQSPETTITTLPNVRLTLFRNGYPTDTLIRKEKLRYPFIAIADSVYVYGFNTTVRPTRSSGPAASRPPLTQPGPWWAYSVITIDSSTLYCGGTVEITAGGDGILEDGSGDATYTGRNDCKWQLTAPAGKKIRCEFEQFDTEPKIDQVYIFNGNSTRDPILAIFSGHKIPPPITSWGNSVLIWFVTNEENNYQGWRLHYKVVN